MALSKSPDFAQGMNLQNLIVFHIGGHHFALPLEDVVEILPLPRLSSPSTLPSAVAGFLDLGDRIVTVLKSGRLLNIEFEPPSLYAHILQLGKTAGNVALLVDGVTSVKTFSSGEIHPVDCRETFRGCVVGQIEAGDRAVHVLSTEALLSNLEKDRIRDFHEAEVRRRSDFGETA